MPVIQKNGVLWLDDALGVLTQVDGVVAFTLRVGNSIGRYATLPSKWRNSMDGQREFDGRFRAIGETNPAATQLRALARAWILNANQPGAKTFQMDVPDSQPGSERYTGEIRIANIDPLVEADAMNDDALISDIPFVGDGALSYMVIV